MLHKELINYQNKLYWVYKTIKAIQIKEEFIQEYKDFILCDLVLKRRNQQQEEEMLLFLREIEELSVLN
jgi:hypothetical protein